jgi:HJR/Mrr/RecB family endonuclease
MDIKNTILNKHFEYIEKIMSIIPAIIALLSIIYVYHSNLNFVEVKLELENILNKLLSLNEFSYIIFMFLILTYFCLDIYIKIRKVIYANDN